MNIDSFLLESVFNYKVKTNEEKSNIKLDENLIRYNKLYQSHDFYENKFPEGFDNIPGFEQIIESIVENSKSNSPLNEYNSRINK
jgi:hypothetical protein